MTTNKQNVPINIIFDGPPGPEPGRFVEVEDDEGCGLSVGEWIDKGNGYWALRITELPQQVYCHSCIAAGGADMPIYHDPPACKNEG